MEEIQAGFRGILRTVLAVSVVTVFFVKAVFIKIRYRNDVVARRRAFSQNSSVHCGLMNKVFNLQVTVKGKPHQGSSFLYVGNHTGFVDIFALASVMPAVFVTSQEMRETPVLGDICEMAGCVFVERRSRTQIMNELGVLKEALEQGLNVVLYPEATSTDGSRVYPFKKTLMMAGPHAGRPIQPGCVNYVDIGGEDFNTKSRDNVCWYGDMSFVTAMVNLLTTPYIKVEIEYLEPITVAPTADRAEVAAMAHSAVSARFRPPRVFSPMDESVAADEA